MEVYTKKYIVQVLLDDGYGYDGTVNDCLTQLSKEFNEIYNKFDVFEIQDNAGQIFKVDIYALFDSKVQLQSNLLKTFIERKQIIHDFIIDCTL